MEGTTPKAKDEGKGHEKEVTVTVNTKPVGVPDNEVTGLQVKEAAKNQGVEIELDFLLMLEGHGGHDPRLVADDEPFKVNKNSSFTCNDGEDDS
jgi:hypothetical protein